MRVPFLAEGVVVSVNQTRPEFVSPLSNVMVRVGQAMKLECKVIGNPKPELTWKLNGKPLMAFNAKVSICVDSIIRQRLE